MDSRRLGRGFWITASLVLAVGLTSADHASGQWILNSEDGKTFLKVGVLAQGRAEWGTEEDQDRVSQNLYLRRARVILSGQASARLSFFLDTDSPNLGRVVPPDSVKSFGDVFLQDLVLTYTVNDMLLLDGGLILVPTSYNHLQSAASLLALDYGPHTFVESASLQEKIGRDSGIQARGLLAEKLVEYRLGVFQGLRGSADQEPLRVTARVAVHPFKTASKGLFYSGTAFGKTKVVALGAAVDAQKDYRSIHADAYAELPLAEGSCASIQLGVSHFDGGDFVPTLVKQTVVLAEGGYTFHRNRFGVWVQASMRDQDDKSATDELRFRPGLSVYLDGHRAALKAGLDIQSFDAEAQDPKSRLGFVIQYQAFHF